MHIPVLLNETIKLLNPRPGEFIIDGTLGGGGHAAEILRRISPGGILLGIDWNLTTIEKTQNKISAISKSEFLISKSILVCGNYANTPEILKDKKLELADGLLLDLGFSSDELEFSGRGFSFRKDEPLLMTYDNARMPVRDILSQTNEEELARIIYEFGEERLSRRIAKAIKESTRKKKIETSGELAKIVAAAAPKNYERGRIHPATRTFQALRIYANDELGNLKTILDVLPRILNSGGRTAIISFHSLEDRLVKNAFRDMAKAGTAEILTNPKGKRFSNGAGKPITPSREEIASNPRSRSAKLRAIRII